MMKPVVILLVAAGMTGLTLVVLEASHLCWAESLPVLSDPVDSACLQRVIGGTGCYVADTKACPMNDLGCHTACQNKNPGDACAEDGYAQHSPNYRKTKQRVDGRKSFVNLVPAKLCGFVHGCGPLCTTSIGGTVCPFSSVADYEIEQQPAGVHCDAG